LFHTRFPPEAIWRYFFVPGGTSQNIFDVNHHLHDLIVYAYEGQRRKSAFRSSAVARRFAQDKCDLKAHMQSGHL
jgi:uncharacterized protein (DUF2461 family)